jgi:hypothetical protein
MNIKRGRVDSHLTRDTYEADEDEYNEHQQGLSSSFSTSRYPGTFSRASKGTIANRRILTATKQFNRKNEFAKHVRSLNQSFLTWFKQQVKEVCTCLS